MVLTTYAGLTDKYNRGWFTRPPHPPPPPPGHPPPPPRFSRRFSSTVNQPQASNTKKGGGRSGKDGLHEPEENVGVEVPGAPQSTGGANPARTSEQVAEAQAIVDEKQGEQTNARAEIVQENPLVKGVDEAGALVAVTNHRVEEDDLLQVVDKNILELEGQSVREDDEVQVDEDGAEGPLEDGAHMAVNLDKPAIEVVFDADAGAHLNNGEGRANEDVFKKEDVKKALIDADREEVVEHFEGSQERVQAEAGDTSKTIEDLQERYPRGWFTWLRHASSDGSDVSFKSRSESNELKNNDRSESESKGGSETKSDETDHESHAAIAGEEHKYSNSRGSDDGDDAMMHANDDEDESTSEALGAAMCADCHCTRSWQRRKVPTMSPNVEATQELCRDEAHASQGIYKSRQDG